VSQIVKPKLANAGSLAQPLPRAKHNGAVSAAANAGENETGRPVNIPLSE